jgi:hypothetical protein
MKVINPHICANHKNIVYYYCWGTIFNQPNSLSSCNIYQNTPQNDATKGDQDSEVTILRKD